MQQEVVTVGVDLAKNVFQVHAIDADGKVLVRRQLRRAEVLTFFAALPPCLVGMKHVHRCSAPVASLPLGWALPHAPIAQVERSGSAGSASRVTGISESCWSSAPPP